VSGSFLSFSLLIPKTLYLSQLLTFLSVVGMADLSAVGVADLSAVGVADSPSYFLSFSPSPDF